MIPRIWWRAIRRSDALGPHPSRSLGALGRQLMAHGPSLHALVAWRAAAEPDRTAIVDGAGVLTYRALIEQSEDLARWLDARLTTDRQAGRRRLAIFARAPRNTIVGLLAAQRLGMNVLLLNTMASQTEVDAVTPSPGCVVVSDDPAIGSLHPPAFGQVDADRDSSLDDKPAGSVERRLRRVRRAPTIAILTSGTTGTPSLVDRRPPVSALDTIADFVLAVGARRGDRVHLMLPVFHGHGLATVALCLLLGGTLHLRSPADQRADGYAADWTAFDSDECDIVVAVPTVLQRLLRAEPAGARRELAVRSIVTGSAPLDQATLGGLTARFGAVVHNVYGTSETGVVTHAGPNDLADDPTTVGRPLMGVQCEVRPHETSGAIGAIGEVWVRGGMAGREWQATHDLGSFDEQGRLRLHGRSDSVLVIGGENVLPEALEARIAAVSGVVECAVRGTSDTEYGTRVELLVCLDAGTSLDDLRATLDATLPRTLRPKSIIEVDRLPRTALGKLQRRSLPPTRTE